MTPAPVEGHLSGMAVQESLGGDMGPQPWAGTPPRSGVDPVGIPVSMTDPVPDSADGRVDLLGRLNSEICTCLKCELGESRTRFVFGVGNPDATLMLIGEAPGAEEDRQGEPFVGKAGQLLTRILEAIDFQREDVYIANILKCRPPNNRDPQVNEVDACEPYLRRQIDLIQPAVICALGRIAGQTLLKTTESLTRLRGKVHHYQGRPLVVTYHPAALLRNPNWKPPTWEDVKMLRRIHDERVGR
ncbi:uracil-DNA glycosylase [Gemmatimonadota bacterium]